MEIQIWIVCVLALFIALVAVGIFLNRQPFTWKKHHKTYVRNVPDYFFGTMK